MVVLEAGGHYDRDSYPRDPIEAITSLYRDAGLTVAEGRPPIPIPVGAGGRRHHRDQLRNLLPRPRAGPGALAAASSASTGPTRPRAPSTPRPRSSCACTPLDPERMGRNGQLAMEGARRSAPAAGRSAATPATACSAAPARSAARSTPSAACTSPTCRARSPPGRGCAPGSRSRRILVEDGARGRGRVPGRRSARPQRHAGAATRSAPGRVIVAGGALGTPELLLRSGLGGAPGRAATSTSTPPAGSAPATTRRCAAGKG